jgi:hypothetical protein
MTLLKKAFSAGKRDYSISFSLDFGHFSSATTYSSLPPGKLQYVAQDIAKVGGN